MDKPFYFSATHGSCRKLCILRICVIARDQKSRTQAKGTLGILPSFSGPPWVSGPVSLTHPPLIWQVIQNTSLNIPCPHTELPRAPGNLPCRAPGVGVDPQTAPPASSTASSWPHPLLRGCKAMQSPGPLSPLHCWMCITSSCSQMAKAPAEMLPPPENPPWLLQNSAD